MRELMGPLPRRGAWAWPLGIAALAHLFVTSLWVSSSRAGWPLATGDAVSWLSSGRPSTTQAAFVLLIIVLLGPVTEELIFRGVLFRKWRCTLGAWPSFWLSSALFGCIHTSHMLISGVQGAVLALVYVRAGTLWAPFLAHAAQNALAILLGAAPARYIESTPALIAVLVLSTAALGEVARRSWSALGEPPSLRGPPGIVP